VFNRTCQAAYSTAQLPKLQQQFNSNLGMHNKLVQQCVDLEDGESIVEEQKFMFPKFLKVVQSQVHHSRQIMQRY
jgi:hypothetical protein